MELSVELDVPKIFFLQTTHLSVISA